MADDEHTEVTLSVLPQAYVYKLPPRPSAGGWKCQEWPKTNHIFTARVRIVARGTQCHVKLEDQTNGNLFALCPLDNERPVSSIEPVSDSSRYFVIRVDDGTGRHAFLGMGFLERDHAFEFNVTLQDHLKRLKYEREAEEAAAAPAPPAQDFSLKGNISIGIPGSGSSSQRARPATSDSTPKVAVLAPPPPAASSGGRRPVSGVNNTPPNSSGGANLLGDPNTFGNEFNGAADLLSGNEPAPVATEGQWVAFS